MTRLVAALALLPAAFATSVLQAAQGTQIVNIVLQANKVTAEVAIDVWNQDKSALFAQSCSRTLASGGFERTPIAFDVDDHGSGNLTVGQAQYTIDEKPELSGGIVCSRIVSFDETLVNCEAPVSASLKLQSLSKRSRQDCFPDGPLDVSRIVKRLENPATANTVPKQDTFSLFDVARPPNATENAAHDKRQGSCGAWSTATNLVGNGNPHQNPLNIQVSVRLAPHLSHCPGDSRNYVTNNP